MPNRLTGQAVPLRWSPNRGEFFLDCVSDAIARVNVSCPEAMGGIDVGVQDVPPPAPHWDDQRVPLAMAVEATSEQAARIVLFRRPLEHRATSRRGLRILVHRTLVEQLSALTGRLVQDIDPEVDDEL